jgi:N-acetylneuraminic acid mutarotase
MKIETIPEATANPASDLGLSNSYPAPCPRWGHTMTKLKNDRLLVYGGQSYDMDGRPIILSDVHVYHPEKKSWEKPINCRGEARQWHSATFLPERQLLLAFGGETYDVFGTKNDKVVTTDSLKVSARFFVYHGTYSVGLKSHFTFSV